MPKAPWTPKDDAKAKQQGWAFFETDDGTQLWKLDEARNACEDAGMKYLGKQFKSDEAALAFVKKNAANGDKFAIKALLFYLDCLLKEREEAEGREFDEEEAALAADET